MGWRDYDAKIGRYLVADEYEGEDTNPVSFNRYLYAESDPVNNIDPDGYAPKWLKKITKGVKKATKAAYNFAIGDDIKTLTSKNTKWYQKAGAAVSIASNFIPGGGVVSKAAKAAIKGASKAVKASKASKAVVQSVKVVKSTAKKAAGTINKKPKVVPASSIKSTPKIQSSAPAKLSATTPAAKPKVSAPPQKERGKVITPVEKFASAGSNGGESQFFMKLDLQMFASKGKGNAKLYSTSRPAYGKGQVEEVWENAKDVDGKVYDPNTGEELIWDKSKSRAGLWDMGHTPENKYSDMHKKYKNGEITKEEFLEWYRNPNNYRPESPSANRSHKYE